MTADRVSVAALFTSFEEKLLRLAAEEEGLDSDDSEALLRAVVLASKRVVTRDESGVRLGTARERFDELLVLTLAQGCGRSWLKRREG